MKFGLTQVTPPVLDPVTLEEAKEQLRQDSTAEDSKITMLIKTATRFAETFTRRALITQTFDLFLPAFPTDDECIIVPNPRLISVGSVKYNQESDGVLTTMASANYDVDTASEPGRIALAFDNIWPDSRDQINAVQVRFDAGYGPDAADVEDEIRQAVMLMVAHWFEVREPVMVGTIVSKVPDSARALLWHHRTFF